MMKKVRNFLTQIRQVGSFQAQSHILVSKPLLGNLYRIQAGAWIREFDRAENLYRIQAGAWIRENKKKETRIYK